MAIFVGIVSFNFLFLMLIVGLFCDHVRKDEFEMVLEKGKVSTYDITNHVYHYSIDVECSKLPCLIMFFREEDQVMYSENVSYVSPKSWYVNKTTLSESFFEFNFNTYKIDQYMTVKFKNPLKENTTLKYTINVDFQFYYVIDYAWTHFLFAIYFNPVYTTLFFIALAVFILLPQITCFCCDRICYNNAQNKDKDWKCFHFYMERIITERKLRFFKLLLKEIETPEIEEGEDEINEEQNQEYEEKVRIQKRNMNFIFNVFSCMTILLPCCPLFSCILVIFEVFCCYICGGCKDISSEQFGTPKDAYMSIVTPLGKITPFSNKKKRLREIELKERKIEEGKYYPPVIEWNNQLVKEILEQLGLSCNFSMMMDGDDICDENYFNDSKICQDQMELGFTDEKRDNLFSLIRFLRFYKNTKVPKCLILKSEIKDFFDYHFDGQFPQEKLDKILNEGHSLPYLIERTPKELKDIFDASGTFVLCIFKRLRRFTEEKLIYPIQEYRKSLFKDLNDENKFKINDVRNFAKAKTFFKDKPKIRKPSENIVFSSSEKRDDEMNKEEETALWDVISRNKDIFKTDTNKNNEVEITIDSEGEGENFERLNTSNQPESEFKDEVKASNDIQKPKMYDTDESNYSSDEPKEVDHYM